MRDEPNANFFNSMDMCKQAMGLNDPANHFKIEYDEDEGGQIIACIESIRGAIGWGDTKEKAKRKAISIALEIIADEIEHGERSIEFTQFAFFDCEK